MSNELAAIAMSSYIFMLLLFIVTTILGVVYGGGRVRVLEEVVAEGFFFYTAFLLICGILSEMYSYLVFIHVLSPF